MNDTERRPATLDPRRQPAPPPLAGGQPLRRPAVASTSGPWPLPHWAGAGDCSAHIAARASAGPPPAPRSACHPATLQPPQPPPRPLPGPQPEPLPRPLTPGLTLAGAACLRQSTASQGQPQALSGFSANHVRSPARLRPHEPVSGGESATRVTHPGAYGGAGGFRRANGQRRRAVSQGGLNQWAVGCGGVTDRGLGLRLPRGRAQRDAGSRGWAGVVAPQPAQPAPGAAASAAQRAPGPPATLAPAASQLRDWPRPRRRRDGQRRRRQEGQRAGER
jgi:hypothetical protein